MSVDLQAFQSVNLEHNGYPGSRPPAYDGGRKPHRAARRGKGVNGR